MTPGRVLDLADRRSMAWLCEMAALGCLHTNRSAWAAQLRNNARVLRQQADEAEGRDRVARATSPRRRPRP